MLSTPHLLVGAAIVKAIPNPALSLPLAFLSHYALDTIPHWDGSPKAPFGLKTTIAIVIDYAIGASLIYLLTVGYPNQYLIWLGAFLGTAPDFILGGYRHAKDTLEKYTFIRVPNEFHIGIQRNLPFWKGLAVSAATSIISILIITNGKPLGG
jgi:hypothetical protein